MIFLSQSKGKYPKGTKNERNAINRNTAIKSQLIFISKTKILASKISEKYIEIINKNVLLLAKSAVVTNKDIRVKIPNIQLSVGYFE